MKTVLALALGSLLTASLYAGSSTVIEKNPATKEGSTQLNIASVSSSYVFSSNIEFANKKVGRGSASYFDFSYTRRIPIQGNWYLQLGADYNRYDFGGSATEFLPQNLQSFAVPIGVSYIFSDHVGFLAEIRPGFHFESEITRGAFDIPFNIGSFITISDRKFYIVWGLGTSIIREWPVIPTVGVVWIISDHFRLMGFVPEPKLIYDLSDSVSIYLGGQLSGGSYKVGYRPDKDLSNTVVDYTDFRAGVGFTYCPTDKWELDVAAGYSFRNFDFHRANKSYRADPAPYIRVQLVSEF